MHEKWMKLALREAETAAQSEEVPIGCVIVKEDTVVAKAHNLCHKHHDPALHAECIALKQAWVSDRFSFFGAQKRAACRPVPFPTT